MNSKKELSLIGIMAILFSVLFHKNPLGLNLLIFESIVLLLLFLMNRTAFRNKALLLASVCFLITAFAGVFVYSFWAFFINILLFIVFIGTLVFPQTKSFFHSVAMSFFSAFQAPVLFFAKLGNTRFKGKSMGIYMKRLQIFLIPLLIIIIFIVIYSNSNPVFEKMLQNIGIAINDAMVFVFGRFDASVILTFLLGLVFSIVIFLHSPYPALLEKYLSKSDSFIRIKQKGKRIFLMHALKSEYKAGIFLFTILNFVLLIVNVIDVNWVWFNFEWSGQYLKQFVHEGTYLLILSIIVSVVLVLYFFRGNLNFYSKNKLLKYLSYAWLLQNGILAISVGIRNFWYIYHFSLAYKRIAVFMFLLLTLYGLYTVYTKVKNNKSAFYMIRHNACALLIVLSISTVFNWDVIIARYNFAHAERSFVHYNFLSNLSYKALPYLDKSLEELENIQKAQEEKFPFEYRYMTAEEYHNKIQRRKERFITKWEKKSWFSWNYPEYKAYKFYKSE